MVATPHVPLVAFTDIKPIRIEGWEQFLLEGEQFLNLAERALINNKKAFSTETLYNLIAMALEKMVMSGLMRIGQLPYNHTMHDLVAALKQWLPEVIVGLEAQLCDLDAFQEICDLDHSAFRTPTRENIAAMVRLARAVELRLAEHFHPVFQVDILSSTLMG